MKVPNLSECFHELFLSLSRLQNEGSQQIDVRMFSHVKSIKATE